ncbi:MAG TPA: YdcF family protein [Arachidicoccus sp.]|nr:YdcF family protein [Arachidicoccus sp.]
MCKSLNPVSSLTAFFVGLLMGFTPTAISAQETLQTAKTSPDQTREILIAKNFPMLAYIGQHQKLRKDLAKYKPLKQITETRAFKLDSRRDKNTLTKLIGQGLCWDSLEVQKVSLALQKFYLHSRAFKKMIRTLKDSHGYALYEQLPDTAFIRAVWTNVAAGLNQIIEVYFLNKKSTYYSIDAGSLSLTDEATRAAIFDALGHWQDTGSKNTFFQNALNLAIYGLIVNKRDEAARYEPITGGWNAAPTAQVKKTDFNKYSYSCILVPGLGPEIKGQRLSPGAKARMRTALDEFNKGVAPFLIVSGGHVHPSKTPYCEAVEMKRFMIDSLDVAPKNVIIEPHARHTTTNLRNATRLIYKFGMPFNKPVLIISDKGQSAYINKGMRKVALRDLGYLPYKELKVLSATETSYRSNIQSLQVDPLDPLDP